MIEYRVFNIHPYRDLLTLYLHHVSYPRSKLAYLLDQPRTYFFLFNPALLHQSPQDDQLVLVVITLEQSFDSVPSKLLEIFIAHIPPEILDKHFRSN